MNIRLLGNRLLVEPIYRKVSHGGILLVPKHHPPSEARLIAVGSHKACDPYRPHVGAVVVIRPMEGSDITVPGDDRRLRLMESAAVLGVLQEEVD